MAGVQAGDVLVAYSLTEDQSVAASVAGGGLTWTQRQQVNVSAYGRAYVWTATATANGSVAVTFTRTAGGTDKHFGGGVVAYRDSAGVGSSAKVNATGAPSLSLTTTEADSAVVVANVDWNAVDGASRTWRSVNGSAATELAYGRSAAHHTAYAGRHANVGAAGSKTLGLSAPSGQKYATVAVEVKGSTTAPPTAEFTFSPTSPVTGEQVSFNSTGACAATPCTYTWEDDGPDGPGGTQWPLGSGQALQYTFSDAGVKKVRLTVTDALSRSATVQHDVTVSEAPALPPLGQPSCQPGAVTAITPAQVRSEIQAGNNVCVTAVVGDVNLDDLTSSTVRHLGTSGIGSIGQVHISGSSRITIRARMRSVVIRGGSSLITVEQSRIGGESHATRVYDQLIFMPDSTADVTIQDNDIGWTLADNSGNTGYGCRCYGDHTRLKFVRNKVHDVAADGFQGVGGDDVLIDRNEIGPVGANPDSDEHSDNIQITGNGPNLRITNNWIHHQGYFNESITGNAGSTYIHGGATVSLIYENNLVEIARGRTEVCGLGTGGTSRSNITLRRNTWVDGGQAFSTFPGFEWDCDSGTGNVVERNVAVDPDGGFGGSVAAATFADNIWGQPSAVTLDGDGNCTSGNCNPSGAEPIGFRKPTGVHW